MRAKSFTAVFLNALYLLFESYTQQLRNKHFDRTDEISGICS